MDKKVMTQTAPWPQDLFNAVKELLYLPGWRFFLREENRGQDCAGLTLSIIPDKPDSYKPDRPSNTRFPYPVPTAAFNRESWEEWLWDRIEETEAHERAEWFRFDSENEDGSRTIRRPYKPAHADGWNPGVVRTVVSDTVTNTPNAGRLVEFPCRACGHNHKGKMGEHFIIVEDRGCSSEICACGKRVGGRLPTEETGECTVYLNNLKFMVAAGEYTGMDIRHFMHPPLPNEALLLRHNGGIILLGDIVKFERDGSYYLTIEHIK